MVARLTQMTNLGVIGLDIYGNQGEVGIGAL